MRVSIVLAQQGKLFIKGSSNFIKRMQKMEKSGTTLSEI
jgi:hypothetical protein